VLDLADLTADRSRCSGPGDFDLDLGRLGSFRGFLFEIQCLALDWPSAAVKFMDSSGIISCLWKPKLVQHSLVVRRIKLG
jgi:hypothetical protein